MIYLKKPDGTIKQYDTVDADEERQLREGLNIDRQLYAQRGVELGEIYDSDSLPDDDKVKIGLMTQAEYILKQKNIKLNEIYRIFKINIQSGSFISGTLGIAVDCRRNGADNDLQNVKELIDNYEDLTEGEKYYIGLTETTSFPLTLDQLKELKKEMGTWGRNLYKKKWALEAQLKNATTEEEINSINW